MRSIDAPVRAIGPAAQRPSKSRAAGLSIAITSSGAFRKFETTPLMTQAETLDALHVAANVHYAPPAEPVHV